MPLVPTRAGEVSYQVRGNGLPIVMLHATLHDRRDYDPIDEHFGEKYQTVTVDWPWHGDSKGTSSKDCLSAVGFADVLEDVVEALKLEPAIFIGNSVGGYAAARLAITLPDRVWGLVLVNCGGFVTWTPVSRLVMPHLVRRYMSPQTDNDEQVSHRVAARAGSAEGASVSAALWRSFLHPGHDLRFQAESIKAPVLIVWGTRDPIFPRAAGEATHRNIAGSKLECFETGHVVFSSKPDDFQRVVDLFIESSMTTRRDTG